MADAVVIGSGINSLACAALLARGGWNVRVLEREDELGGCIRTAALTEPGYLHDVFSAWHPPGRRRARQLGDSGSAGNLLPNTDHREDSRMARRRSCSQTEANVT
jgi:phytoene dehydrogenase-like protein